MELPSEVRFGLMLFQGVVLTVGFGGFAFFTQRVFRPTEAWARFAAAALPAASLVSVLGLLIEPDAVAKAVGRSEGGGIGISYLVQQLVGLMVLCWTAFEALRHFSALRRQLAIGLGDAIVANRIALWGCAMAVAALMSAATTGAYALGVDPMASLAGMGAISVLGIIAASGIYLAFLPPQLYLSWLRERTS